MRLALASTLLLSLASPALAQTSAEPRSGFWDLLTADRIVTAVFHQMMGYARIAADVRYDALSVDAVGGTVRLVGLEVTPLLPYGAPDACTIRAAYATLQSSGFDQIDTIRGQISLDKALVDFDCLPPEARPVLGMMNVGDLAVDRLNFNMTYDLPSGGARAQLQLGVDGLATVLASADFDYLSFRMDFTAEEPQPAAYLNAMQIQVEDSGLLERLRQILPPEVTSPDALELQTRQIMNWVLSEVQTPYTPAQTALANQATEMARAIGNGATRIVLETDIAEAPVILREDELQNAPVTVLEKLNLQISPASVATIRVLPADLLAQARSGDISSDEDRLRVGRALLTGTGAPRNVALGLDILTPLIDAGLAEPARLAAEALIESDPARAYQFALTAAVAGDSAAIGLLDRAENRLGFAQVIEAQSAQLPDDALAPTRFNSLADMRRAALDHMIGLGSARSYPAAYFWASMAAAGGDVAAAGLRDDLSERMRRRGLATEWSKITDALDTEILDGWVSANIPAIASQD